MTDLELDVQARWAPDVCTLPTTERPIRERDFDDLLTAAVSVTRLDALTASFQLRPEPEVAAQAAQLAARETGCCSFFAFTLSIAHERLSLSVAVPAEHRSILDALAPASTGPDDH